MFHSKLNKENHVAVSQSEAFVRESVVVENKSAQIQPEYMAPKGYLCFAEAREFAKNLNIKTRREWRLYVNNNLEGYPEKPDNIPSHPDGIYKVKGWQGWKYWLGSADKGFSEN